MSKKQHVLKFIEDGESETITLDGKEIMLIRLPHTNPERILDVGV